MQGVFSWCNRKPLLLGSTFACLMVFYLPNRCIVPIEAHNDADTDGDPGYLAQVPGMPLQRHRFTEDQKTRHRYAKDVLADSFSPTDTCQLFLSISSQSSTFCLFFLLPVYQSSALPYLSLTPLVLPMSHLDPSPPQILLLALSPLSRCKRLR